MDTNLIPLSDWRNWPGLPKHLLSDIATRLTAIDDYLALARVCSSWQSIYQDIFTNSIFLLIAPRVNDEAGNAFSFRQRRAIYNVSDKMVYDLRVSLPHDKHCCGLSFGWLATAMQNHKDSYSFQLQNPFLDGVNVIDLPTVEACGPYEHCLPGEFAANRRCKVVLSSDPLFSDNFNFTAVAILRPYLDLAFCKPGDANWTPIGLDRITDSNYGRQWLVDVIYYHTTKQIYVLDKNGAIFAVDLSRRDQNFLQIAPPAPRHTGHSMYLLEDLSLGDLLVVYKDYFCAGFVSDINFRNEDAEEKVKEEEEESMWNNYVPIRFTVFKFSMTDKTWIEMHNLGVKALFVGNNCSILRSASDCPGIRSNHIYYHIDRDWGDREWRNWYGPTHEAIYNLEDGTIRTLYAGKYTEIVPASTIWLEPPTFRS